MGKKARKAKETAECEAESPQPKEITLIIQRIFPHELVGPIQAVVDEFKKLQEKHPRSLIKVDYGGSDHPSYVLVETRLETDAEFKARLKKEKEEAATQLEAVRQTYERLKKRLGDKECH